MKKKKNLAKVLDMSATAMPSVPQIELLGDTEAIVEGCRGIMEYSKEIVRLNLGSMSVCFYGQELDIKLMNVEQALIEGQITSVEFVKVR